MENNKISVVINTYNAEKHLEQVLESVKDFDEIVICDMQSTDHTLEIARKFHCKIVTFEKKDCNIVEPARQFAIDNSSYKWVLVVDADEIVPSSLRTYLYEQISKNDTCPSGIAIPRKNYFMGTFLHSCYPDHILRFFNREVTYWPPVIHTSPQINGFVYTLSGKRKELAFEHLANDSVADIFKKINTYSDYELIRRRNKNYGLPALLLKPTFRFFKSYILKKGFLDGLPGFIHAVLDATYQFAIVAKFIEKRNQ